MMSKHPSHFIDIAVLASVVLHIGFLLLFSRATPAAKEYLDLQEVTFMDVTYRPEVAKILPKAAIGGQGGNTEISGPVATYGSGIASEETGAIDMNATIDRNPSQAKIDLDRYELNRGDGLDVIRLGGKGSNKSTDEILAQPKVALARGLSHGSGSGYAGLRGYPGVKTPTVQLTIEHRSLAKKPAKKLPQMPARNLPKVTGPVSKGTHFMVAGPISKRQIVKKIVPRYPKWALERRISGTVVIRLWVQPNGNVKGMPTVESSSGYPDLDQVVIAALLGWKFAPLGSGVKSEDQWGRITFKFTLS